MEKMFK